MTGNISINKQDFYKNLTGYSFMPNIYCHNLNLTQLQPELGVLTPLSVHAQSPGTPSEILLEALFIFTQQGRRVVSICGDAAVLGPEFDLMTKLMQG